MERASKLSTMWLEEKRLARGWTQEYVAQQLEVDPKTIQRWEQGKNQPQPRQYKRLCDLFHVQEIPSATSINDFIENFTESDLTSCLLRILFRKESLARCQSQLIVMLEADMTTDAMNRRDALRRLVAVPLLWGLSLTSSELLTQIAAGVTALWYLRRGKDFTFVLTALLRYIPLLQGAYHLNEDASNLLAQCLLLKATCEEQLYRNYAGALQDREKAELHSKSILLKIASLRAQAVAYWYTEDWGKAIQVTEKAKALSAQSPLMLQSYVLCGLAKYKARIGSDRQEIFTLIGQAQQTYGDAQVKKETAPLWTGYDEGNLWLNVGLAYSHIDEPKQAIAAFSHMDTLNTHETYLVESYLDRVMIEATRENTRDMEFCIDYWTRGLQGAIALQSEEKYEMAKVVYAALRGAWPGETRIKGLSGMIQHW